MKWTVFVSGAAAWLVSGCALFGGLHVEEVATSAQKPSNVAVYVSVTEDGHAVKNLTAESFKVFEDNQELPADQTKQVLLPRDMAAVHRALLLVDMSGPVTQGDTRDRIAAAAARFVSRAHVSQPVTVYAFDGGAAIRLIGEYPEGNADVAEIPELRSYEPADTSSNLNSAIVEALSQLDARLMTTQKPLRVGSLVVFARGADLAGRVPDDKTMEALNDTLNLVFAIGIEGSTVRAQRYGENGSFTAESMATLDGVFGEAGEKVADMVGSYYLLAYCTPSRAGTRRLRVEATRTDAEGKALAGSMTTEFDSTGFGSDCDPTAPPRFVAKDRAKAEPVPAPPPAESTEGVPAEGEKKPAKKGVKLKAAPPAPAGTPPPPPATDDDDDGEVVPPPSKPGYAP